MEAAKLPSTTKPVGIIVPKTIGIGDAIEFTSLPENYFFTHRSKLVDMERHWVFDHNPFVDRSPGAEVCVAHNVWKSTISVQKIGRPTYSSLSEKHALVVGCEVTLRHPRLYCFEEFPYHARKMILIQVEGKSHGRLPDKVIRHIVDKYNGPFTFQIGLTNEDIGVPWIETKTIWDLVELISTSRMVIGPDSGPTWIGSCYPDVVVKKVRMKPSLDVLKTWVPLATDNIHAQWDDLQLFSVYNPSEDDVGFTSSYKKL